MKFGYVPLTEAVGSISAHAVRAGEVVLRKGSRVTGEIAEKLRAGRDGARCRAARRRRRA